MTEEILKDNRGVKIGKIVTETNGILRLKDAYGRNKGTYEPHTNKTKDERGVIVGTGNMLIRLL